MRTAQPDVINLMAIALLAKYRWAAVSARHAPYKSLPNCGQLPNATAAKLADLRAAHALDWFVMRAPEKYALEIAINQAAA